jgi:hypothetical protein
MVCICVDLRQASSNINSYDVIFSSLLAGCVNVFISLVAFSASER